MPMRDYFIFHTDSRTNDVFELKIWEDHYPLYKKHENLIFRDPGDGHIYIGGKNKLKFASLVSGTKPTGYPVVLRCRNGDHLLIPY